MAVDEFFMLRSFTYAKASIDVPASATGWKDIEARIVHQVPVSKQKYMGLHDDHRSSIQLRKRGIRLPQMLHGRRDGNIVELFDITGNNKETPGLRAHLESLGLTVTYSALNQFTTKFPTVKYRTAAESVRRIQSRCVNTLQDAVAQLVEDERRGQAIQWAVIADPGPRSKATHQRPLLIVALREKDFNNVCDHEVVRAADMEFKIVGAVEQGKVAFDSGRASEMFFKQFFSNGYSHVNLRLCDFEKHALENAKAQEKRERRKEKKERRKETLVATQAREPTPSQPAIEDEPKSEAQLAEEERKRARRRAKAKAQKARRQARKASEALDRAEEEEAASVTATSTSIARLDPDASTSTEERSVTVDRDGIITVRFPNDVTWYLGDFTRSSKKDGGNEDETVKEHGDNNENGNPDEGEDARDSRKSLEKLADDDDDDEENESQESGIVTPNLEEDDNDDDYEDDDDAEDQTDDADLDVVERGEHVRGQRWRLPPHGRRVRVMSFGDEGGLTAYMRALQEPLEEGIEDDED